jgi:poly(3-hydroxybutyrate) depolymerase
MNNLKFSDYNQIYNIFEYYRNQISPFRLNLLAAKNILNSPLNPFSYTYPGSIARATIELAERVTRRYEKQEFNITEAEVEGRKYKVETEVVDNEAFCNFTHFSKRGCHKKLPKMIIVAPMAGHHATLLRNTVEELIPYFDIYITDWIDANQVPLVYGGFDLDTYIDYLIQFMGLFTDPVHILAVCQPTVPVLAAVSIMSQKNSKFLPASMTLMGGPIDARENPTSVNDLAVKKNIKWFEDYLIATVPNNYPGAGRKVYPGFLQLAGFMSLNLSRHATSHVELFKDMIKKDHQKVEKHINHYDEYLSVMDIPAEFYIQTIKEVFQKFSLAKGKLKSKGRDANVENIKNVAILGVEGENDNIAAVGQTKAALELCKNIPEHMKHYHLQKGVGHYGVFSGSKFKQEIVPVIRDFAYKYDKKPE